ncbi:YdiU family protein [Chroococcidiopsis sp. CCMEE 29]|uniref:protein adenylyltransferase SelO n=1 Tax=Chroococcidiopsis sp. CCMEE 29 TaxID=155894 RepID=UPI0020205A95|nr:YdiU family protein [Chroococcidiopsis sp. CCMEE 29]
MSLTETSNNSNSPNPFLTLNYEPALESLGGDYFDQVKAAEFPHHILRFRNDQLLPKLGLDPQAVTDADFIEAFGQFQAREPLLALRYHGYQFGEYNPFLGDGRGFLYGQVRGTDAELYDFGTKGSGTTPYSRSADGRLTLKGGVREVLAAEALHQMSVRTSRCLSMIETGESLWRGDEPSPTRSAVMVRFSRSHIRFGTFERFHYIERPDLIKKLLDHVIEYYYPSLHGQPDSYALFYAELVQRVAELTAQWMAAGFCHGVLNTDNMSITGESFDYGPYAFIPTYDRQFTAAYFDYFRRYSYGRQPSVCKLNLELLQVPLEAIIGPEEMEVGLAMFDEHYHIEYRRLILNKLGFSELTLPEFDQLLGQTIRLLQETQIGYHEFFIKLSQTFSSNWRDDASLIFKNADFLPLDGESEILENWRNLYQQILNKLPPDEMGNIAQQMQRSNPKTVLLRPVIESVWEPIANEDNWQPFYDLLSKIQSKN